MRTTEYQFVIRIWGSLLLKTINNLSNLSIIIPVGPNDHSWQGLLNELSLFGNEIEIIISACLKQPDDSRLLENVRWIQSTQGRAQQLNAGAEKATGKLFWFLHADTRFTEDITEAIHFYLNKSKLRMGYFRLKFASDGPKQTQLNAWAANIRSQWFGLPFGVQGFIMNKTIFDGLNGLDNAVSVGEDLDFVIRAKAAGIRLQEIPCELITSSRRYQQYGWLSTSIKHIYLTWTLTRQAKQRLALS